MDYRENLGVLSTNGKLKWIADNKSTPATNQE